MRHSAHAAGRRRVLKSALGLAAMAALPAGARAAAARNATVTATLLNDRLLLVSGLGGNVLALRGDEGLLLVDTGAPGSTAKLQAELRRFAPGAKVTTVINTHWHADHTGGNEVFGASGARIIAHAKAAQRMAVDQYVPWEDRYIKARAKAAVPGDVFYVGSRELRFGGDVLEYGYLQQPHTDGDLYVHLRSANVLVAGDAISPQADPQICWFEGGWVGGRVDAQSKLLALGNDATRIVAGTGGVVSRAEVKVERDALANVFDRISDAMRKGFTTEDMQKAKLVEGVGRTWADPDKFIYDAHKSMWAHYNKLSHTIV